MSEHVCGFCGESVAEPGWCSVCREAPKCDACGDPCPEGHADKENNLCERCSDEATSAEREAARREFDRREAALDDEYSRRKDERAVEMLREVRR